MSGGAGVDTNALAKHWFVGREEVIAPVLDFLQQRQPYRLQALGTWGMGKSWLVDELAKRAKSADFVVFPPVRASNYIPRAKETAGVEPEAAQMVRNFEAYVRLLQDMLKVSPADKMPHGLATLAEKVANARDQVAKAGNAGVVNLDFHPEMTAEGSMQASG